jgi:hypothetical protein
MKVFLSAMIFNKSMHIILRIFIYFSKNRQISISFLTYSEIKPFFVAFLVEPKFKK